MAQAASAKKDSKPRTTLGQLSKVASAKRVVVSRVASLEKQQSATQVTGSKRPPSKRATVPKPVVPHPLESLLGDVLINAKGNVISPKVFSVENGVIGLYFAAHWCPPCRSFCPNLMLLYNELKKAAEAIFEVIYVSLDSKESSFREYLAKMPWYAIPFSEEEKREEIALNFGIKGIPVLLLLDAQTLNVIAFNGREIVFRDPRGALFPWKNLPDDQRSSVTSSAALSTSSKATSIRMSLEHKRRASEIRNNSASSAQTVGAGLLVDGKRVLSTTKTSTQTHSDSETDSD